MSAPDWIATARRRDDGTSPSVEDVMWLMGSAASDLSREKRRARRILSLVVAIRTANKGVEQ